MGIFGGVAIVLPYLLPFLVGLALLEDSGYLPRVAFLMDNLMHLLGLHGKSIIPFILGYGCSVPAVMSTRILESPRDRLVVALLAVLIPCSARSVIIFALVAYALGPVLGPGGLFLQPGGHRPAGADVHLDSARGLPGPAHGNPRIPLAHLEKRGSQVLAQPEGIHRRGLAHPHCRQPDPEPAASFTTWRFYVNDLCRPFTALLGLPAAVGTTLIFGIMRKELALIMLTEALGTTQIRPSSP